jgi:hypothetical protein
MKKLLPVAGALCILLLLSGCVSSPASTQNSGTDMKDIEKVEKSSQKAPDWFFRTPEDDGTYKYFVGSGMSETRNVAEAEDDAVRDLTDTILMYIGIEVTSETEALGIGSIDEFKTEITQVVTSTGKAQIAGFEIQEKLPHETDDGLLIYILARYNKKDLEAEKAKIQREIEEKYEAVSLPEEEGKELFSRGQYYQAAIKFIQAADAAANEIVANAQIKFERNINQAMDSIERINLIPLSGYIEGFVGQELPESFNIKVVSGGSAKDTGVPGVTIQISYKAFNAAKTRLNIKTTSMKTDAKGMLAFVHPVPEFTGSEKVSMLLDFDEHLEILDDIPGKWYDAVDALEELILSKKLVFDFKILSNARNIDTGIVIIDLDENNEPIPGSQTGPVVLQELSSQQYRIRNINAGPADIVDRGDFEVIEKLAAEFGAKVQRAIYGTARILEITEDSGQVFVKTTATIQVVDLKTEEILLSVVKTANGMGNTEQKATNESFKRLGSAIGKDILNQLR